MSFIYKENTLKAHSDHYWYKDGSGLENRENPDVVSLNGMWKFAYAKNDSEVPLGYQGVHFDCSDWDEIPVPSHIQLNGYDRPQYVNQQYPWDGREDVQQGEAPVEFNPVGCYVKYFDVSLENASKRTFISFQGAESDVSLWLNGAYIGYATDSFTPHDFELTDHIIPGENKLAVRVNKWNPTSWFEDQDFFRFSGLYRDVFLYTVDDYHIMDISLVPKLSEDYSSGTLRINGSLLPESNVSYKIRASLDGNKIEESFKEGSFSLCLNINNPRLWSAEYPNLYEVCIEVLDTDGSVREVVCERVGFRIFKLEDGLMKINEKRIEFRGVNRHEFSGDVGRAITKEHILRDLITIKQNNMNAVRTCHYPNSSYFYRLADELGLYIIAENNMETHGTWQGSADRIATAMPGDDTAFAPMLFDRIDSTYETHKNHPSILIWSVGNESFGGSVIRDMANRFRTLDNTRLVHYEGVFNDRRYSLESSDMESQMYPSTASIEEFLNKNPGKPFICCEYAHAMGNSLGALDYYTKLCEKNPRYQGGFIWDYMDQAILSKDRFGNDTYLYGGDFDDRPTDYSFSGDGLCFADGRCSPKMQEVKFLYQGIFAEFKENGIKIKNRNIFAGTNDYDCIATLKKEGKVICETPIETNVSPESEGIIPYPFKKEKGEGEYVFSLSFRLREDTLWAKAGFEVAYGECTYGKYKPKEGKGEALKVIETDFNIGVLGKEFSVLFSKLEGGLSSYEYKGKQMLKSIPLPNFWRPVTENDHGGQLDLHMAQWKIASEFVSVREYGKLLWSPDYNPLLTVEGDYVKVKYTYHMPTNPASLAKVSYKIASDGRIKVTLKCKPERALPSMPEFGMILKMDADFNNLCWYGNGPDDCYEDRQKGARLSVYHGKVSEQMARYLRPQESGNHTGVRWAKVTNKEGLGLMFTGDKMNFSALPWTPAEIDCANHHYELPPINYTVIRPALRQMGVGGDDTWGSVPHPEFWLPKGEKLEFEFTFVGIDEKRDVDRV